MAKRIDENYVNSMPIEQLRREFIFEMERHHALMEAFRELPDVPDTMALHLLNDYANWSRDHERGINLQRESGLDAIPPNSECETGAGLWSIIRPALLAAVKE